MTIHPLFISVIVLDGASVLLLVQAARIALGTVAGWCPHSAGRHQISLEIQNETGGMAVRWAVALFFTATMLHVAGIALVLPHVVPGAMCGTGVLQASGASGSRAFMLRFVTCAALYYWWVLDRLNGAHPESPATRVGARVLLALFPLAVLSLGETAGAARALNIRQPVNCCAVVYDNVSGMGDIAGSLAAVPDRLLLALFMITGAGLLTAACGVRSSRASIRRKAATAQMLAGICWVPLAGAAMMYTLSAYYYGVLNHHCPWCLFLPEHGLAGFPIFGTLAIVLCESPAAAIALRAAAAFPALSDAAVRRARTAGTRVALASGAFFIFALLPPLVWRIRHGVWMG